MYILPAEWHPQRAVLLAWPHEASDWQPLLDRAEQTFSQIIHTIRRFESVILLCHDEQTRARAQQRLNDIPTNTRATSTYPLHYWITEYNDTWIRDYGPLTCFPPTLERVNNTPPHQAQPHLLDFTFNGWGLKFAAEHDNQVNQRLEQQGLWDTLYPYPTKRVPQALVLEGGSIESDGAGTLMTTAHCLMAPNRNQPLTLSDVTQQLRNCFNQARLLLLEQGQLIGDDTDGHIDTLARFCSHDTLVFQGCQRASDPHYRELQKMSEQLASFKTADGAPYNCLPLPLPEPKYNRQQERLPATYANFLIVNGAVLVPTYADPNDAQAMQVIQHAFPDRTIVGIDCTALVEQGGSLHCSTMQLPQAT